MKVSHILPYNAYNNKNRVNINKSVKEDENFLKISDSAKDFSNLMSKVKNSDNEKVLKIKEQLKNNTYNISIEDVANKIIDNIYR